jgi:cell volume regulation protein A
MITEITLFTIGIIILAGYVAEFLFQKLHIPDSLLLIGIGFILGRNILNLANTESFSKIAPAFTTFTLVFIMFVGATNIDIKTFLHSISSASKSALINFLISSFVISVIFIAFGYEIIISVFLGFSLSGLSAAFVIPLIMQLKLDKNDKFLFNILTIESALTDVFSIVFAVTMMNLISEKVLNIQTILSQFSSLFIIAGIVGFAISALIIYLDRKKLRSDKNYMIMIAVVLITYFLTEFLHGSGVIAVMFLGVGLNNAGLLTSMFFAIEKVFKPKAHRPVVKTKALTKREKMFYEEISFFLKTFFFVYIGMMLNISNLKVLAITIICAVGMSATRYVSTIFFRGITDKARDLLVSMYARGLAAAALIQIAFERGIIKEKLIMETAYCIITASIIFSSVHLYIIKKKLAEEME